MADIIRGTTPTIKFKFDTIKVSDITAAYLTLNAGDVLVVRARARSSSYYMYVGNLIIEQIS